MSRVYQFQNILGEDARALGKRGAFVRNIELWYVGVTKIPRRSSPISPSTIPHFPRFVNRNWLAEE